MRYSGWCSPDTLLLVNNPNEPHHMYFEHPARYTQQLSANTTTRTTTAPVTKDEDVEMNGKY